MDDFTELLNIKWKYIRKEISKEEARAAMAAFTDMCLDTEEVQGDYGPILRLSRFCSTLEKWASLCWHPRESDTEYKKTERTEFYTHWSRIHLAIVKSNLLARMFFSNETPRILPCPVHKGHWTGCWTTGSGTPPCECQAGGNVTGWLPEPGQQRDLDHWDYEKNEYRRAAESEGSPRIG